MKCRTIKNDFTRNLVLILVCSFAVTILVWWTITLIHNDKMIRSANYYEKHIPYIADYVKRYGEVTMSSEGQEPLEKIIPLEGMSYSVLSPSGEFLYGDPNIYQQIDRAEVLSRLNNVYKGESDNYIEYVPIMAKENQLLGTLLLSYRLIPTAADPKFFLAIPLLSWLFILSPFLSIILFTYLFGRRFSRKLGGPLKQLMSGAKRIKERDLDFTMAPDPRSLKEVNQLIEAFESMRQELKESLEREWKLEQDRKTMFAALAHDLRTPLTIIQGHVEGLEEKEKFDEEKLSQYLKVIKRNTKRASNLLKDINTITEIENVAFQLRPIPVDIDQFVDEKTGEYATLCRAKSITFHSQITDERTVKERIIFDPYRIAQVLDNLVGNSIRYTPDMGNIVWSIELNDQQVNMAITDNGTGFRKHALEEVFDPFYQADSRTARQKGHSGLGLYIAKMLVLHHDGHIYAENNTECGATVRVTLPLKQENAPVIQCNIALQESRETT